MTKFPERLRTIADASAFNNKQIADELLCAPSTFLSYKNGGRTPRFETLLAISSLFEVNLHWLLTGDGPVDLPDAAAARPLPCGSTAGKATLSDALPDTSDAFHSTPTARPYRIRDWLADALGLSCIVFIAWFGLVAGWVMS